MPICLLNITFRMFTEVATNHVNKVVDHIMCPTQWTLMSGSNILEGYLSCMIQYTNYKGIN